MVKSQILRSVDFTEAQTSRYLENQTFVLQIKKILNYTSMATLWQKNCFVTEETFKKLLA